MPTIPAIRWPGTVQKYVYVPGFRFSVSVLTPPWKVGVAPRILPFVPSCSVKLCASGDEFANAIVTLPAFALSVLFVYFRSPLGFAAIASAPEAPVDTVVEVDAGVEVEDEAEVAGALAADEVVLLLLLLDPPQAARPNARTMLLSAIVVSLSIGTVSLRLVLASDGPSRGRVGR